MTYITLNFYDELAQIILPKDYVSFKEAISKEYNLEPSDVDELIIFYKSDENPKNLIKNDKDYDQSIVSFFSSDRKGNDNYKFFIEISEQSKLYKKELEYSKVFVSQPPQMESFVHLENSRIEKERLRKEIEDKEKLLKELLEKERLEKEKKDLELKEKLQKEKEVKERLDKEKLEKEKLENERLVKERAEKERQLNERLIKEQLEKEKLEQQRIERELLLEYERKEKELLLQKQKQAEQDFEKTLRDSVIKAVSESINLNVEKFKEEISKKAIEQASSAIEKVLSNSSIYRNEEIHHGIKCSNCFSLPIIGVRYKCNVCINYDLCSACETILGDSHCHPMTKHRISVNIAKPEVKPDNIIFEELCKKKLSQKELNVYRPQLNIIRNEFFISVKSDYEILTALYTKKGNIDEALELLISHK
jgi:hypothetical protein